jgi:glycosyltransferase involved in cell wall biosynthesis
MPELAVVLISKNQAWNIGRLIESIILRTACVPSREMVLVDSASTDDTVATASMYAINVLRLRPDQPLSPAAGRYVGYKHTSAPLVLFLDGDMELCAGWLERALKVLRSQPDVAVVTGLTVDVWPATKAADSAEAEPSLEYSTGLTEVPYIAGAGLYRRQALEHVGSFNPYLYSDEEPELCIRIRQAGYRIVQLDTPIAYHYSTPSEALSTLVNRWRRNLYLGAGQCLRYHFGTKTFWPYLRERGYGCVPGVGLAAGILGFGWSFYSQQWLWFQFWLLLFVMLVVVDTYRKQSLSLTVASLLKRLFIVDGTVRGFLLKPLTPESYPEKLDVIKQVS